MEANEWKELAFALADKAAQKNLSKIAIKSEGFSIEVETHAPSAAVQTAAPVMEAAVQPQQEQKTYSGTVVHAPLVGTFYEASAPEQPPMIVVGDHVRKGQTLCIIEAMKMMNTIECPCDGEVTHILAQNGALVEYNQPLIVIE